MGFRINTNIAAMSAHTNSVMNNRNLDSSLGKLSSGLRIQTAADDASGMSIADSLRAQANGLGQAIKNGNDAIGIVQTADKAMDEQIKILDTIKTKAIQAAQDGQSSDSRRALQNDISRLLEELDNIAKTTSFNGQQLLNGSFSNKEFQIGAYSNETAKVSIGATDSNSIGHTRFETTNNTVMKASLAGDLTVKLSGIDGFPAGYTFKTVDKATLKQDGYKAIAEQINAMTTQTGVKASVKNVQVMSTAVTAGTIHGLKINDVLIGDITIKAGDDGKILTAAINAKKDETGVEASIENGKLTLATKDGRAINVAVHTTAGNFSLAGGAKVLSKSGTLYLGQLTFTRQDARDIKVGINGISKMSSSGMSMGFLSSATITKAFNQASVNLKYMNSGNIISTIAQAMGFFNGGEKATAQSGGVNTFAGAQAMIDIAESAQKTLDRIRADLGSVQNQLVSTINNISVTQVNVKSAESQIRDVDFAEESANFSKFNILAQSGSYAMSQANTVQQNVLRLLQ
ncbi:flagellin B [Campylobacter hyointestinalis]|uniref:flagellin B n=1 Tax=Campylobacter hyointestinalis TaxID=198 RepID=UPI0004D833D4|nr:flagellin B [Campylobacter hyointestinalis]KEA44698.1 flagellin B [Campylobacter hyointestinalis subsp. hyointestinalis]QKF56410.1 flagellin [Campylobacter hyointestinalis subsp. hyointestinalis]TXK46564.1 flagellin B [Campylobacter hyointestinalis]SUW91214.1 flagellin B [Campylobacter hyointestinalis]